MRWTSASHAIAFLLLLFPAQPAQAVTTYLTLADGSTLTLHTGTIGAQCTVQDLGGDTEVECTDTQGNLARADSAVGCLETRLLGFCARGLFPGLHPNAAAQLTCGDRDFNVGTGTAGGTCERAGDNMTCDDGNGNSSSANCSVGCTRTTNSGCCCREGTHGCGSGSSCNGK